MVRALLFAFEYNIRMYVVYLIQHNGTGDLYVGRTNNLARRLEEHNSSDNSSTIRKTVGKWEVIYAEAYRDKQDAVIREKKLKQRGTAKQGLKKRLTHSLLKIKK